MKYLDQEYLKKNGFKKVGDKSYMSVVRGFVEEGAKRFSDERQLALIKAQFDDRLDDVYEMTFIVRPINCDEFEVVFSWTFKSEDGKKDAHSSSICGADLYRLISQAIVNADADELL